jgi:GNAT superfamily N-acetyltransferase
MTDVLGVCVSWADGRCVVRREDGALVEMATADIVSGKPVPPRPSVHRRLGAEEADRLALPGWQPVESEPLGEWVLRASGGFSSRGNSVLALGDPDLPLEEAVGRVEEWYRSRSLPPRAHVHPGGQQSDAFARAGWTSYDETLLMLASVARVLRRLPPAREDVAPVHEPTADAGWLATDERAARYGQAARAVMEHGEVSFVTVRDEQGAVLARGRGAFHADWIGVSALWTRPDVRGSGLGSAVLRSVLDWGAERGATTTYLQVIAANAAAQQLYESHGYDVHHRYGYLVADFAS